MCWLSQGGCIELVSLMEGKILGSLAGVVWFVALLCILAVVLLALLITLTLVYCVSTDDCGSSHLIY